MTLSYIEMIMLSAFSHAVWSIFNKDGAERAFAIACVVCNIFVLSNKAWSMIP